MYFVFLGWMIITYFWELAILFSISYTIENDLSPCLVLLGVSMYLMRVLYLSEFNEPGFGTRK